MILSKPVMPLFFLLFLGISWGLYFSMLKIAVLSGISYYGIAALTTLGVALGMSAIAVARRKPPRLSAIHLRFYLICALLGYLLPMLCELLVIRSLPAGALALIVSLTPIATLIVARLMKTDVVNRSRIAGILLGAFAIFGVLLPEVHSQLDLSWFWLMVAVLIPLFYALYHNYIARYWPNDSDTYQVACGEAVMAFIAIATVAFWQWQPTDVAEWNSGHNAMLFMAVISLADIYIYFELIRLRGPIFTSHANYIMVISGVFWGFVIFNETITHLMWVSVSLLLVSLFLVSRQSSATGLSVPSAGS
ncbi:MAG: drug/metabolite transporter (DMT)-like permease [Gammaproteobacteria bacterium]|jgi:drug/metabolite transporter (DMT)-like permease